MTTYCTYKTAEICVCLDDHDLCPTIISARKAINNMTTTPPEVATIKTVDFAEPVRTPSPPKAAVDQIASTLSARGNCYGDFSGHAQIAQDLQDVMRLAQPRPMDGRVVPAGSGWHRLSPVQKQALTVIADKIARILNGDPNYDDNWIDIQGYARLAQERL
jgi:hypothetical protein